VPTPQNKGLTLTVEITAYDSGMFDVNGLPSVDYVSSSRGRLGNGRGVARRYGEARQGSPLTRMKPLFALALLLSPATAGEVTCAPAPGGYTHCWDSATGRSTVTIERQGDLSHAFDPNTGRTVETCEDRRGVVQCWR
jgi:hypothetical protein